MHRGESVRPGAHTGTKPQIVKPPSVLHRFQGSKPLPPRTLPILHGNVIADYNGASCTAPFH